MKQKMLDKINEEVDESRIKFRLKMILADL
jgi:hypothetical protein